MAVTLSGTGREISATGTGTVTANVWAIARIRWDAPVAALGNRALVTDTSGAVIFDSTANGADWSDEIELGKVAPILGVIISTLDTGTLRFYLR